MEPTLTSGHQTDPAVRLDERRSKTIHIATSLSILSFIWLGISLCTPCWIEADRRIYNNPFDKLGLWVFCFRSFTDPKRRNPQYFVACRWFFDFEWKFMFDVLAPPFFVVVQFSFGVGFLLLLISMVLLALLWVRCFRRHEHELLYVMAFMHIASAFWFFIAYTTFGARAYDPTWLPGSQNNYLSWSFGLAVVGGLQLFVCSILYYTEAKTLSKKLRPSALHEETSQLTASAGAAVHSSV